MDNCDVMYINLRVIKRCGMYTKEYKNWISHENKVPPIVETINSFNKYWAGAIALVNIAVPALQLGYKIAAIDNDASVATYDDLLANFCSHTRNHEEPGRHPS